MAGVFAGMYQHSLDAKGRLIIPANYREMLGSGFTITINSTIEALVIYPASKWESVYTHLMSVRDTDTLGMDYKRFLASNAQTEIDMDSQGRVLIPIGLREAAGLTKEVTFVGMLDNVEIWDTKALVEKTQRTRANLSAQLKHVDETYATAKRPAD